MVTNFSGIASVTVSSNCILAQQHLQASTQDFYQKALSVVSHLHFLICPFYWILGKRMLSHFKKKWCNQTKSGIIFTNSAIS